MEKSGKMNYLPPSIHALYRIASPKEVRSWSFGELTAVRKGDATSWQQSRGTLDDQAIFGPLRDFLCACGKYCGQHFARMICDRCGVKVAHANIRRTRFAHLDLVNPIPHPLGQGGEVVESLPILPAAFVQSPRGSELADAYENLISVNQSHDPEGTADAVVAIHQLLVPIFIVSHEWHLQEADIFARGLCLVRTSEADSADDRCENCGYPLGGLRVATCPACGTQNERNR
jgi:hypothetical protein